MNIHKNARLTPHSRAEAARRVLDGRETAKAVATARRGLRAHCAELGKAVPGRRPSRPAGSLVTAAPVALAGERNWLLTRIAEAPDLTLRAIAAELAERGTCVASLPSWHAESCGGRGAGAIHEPKLGQGLTPVFPL